MASRIEARWPHTATEWDDPALDAAFTLVVDEYRERIRRYVLHLVRDPDEAEDLTQETFLRGYGGFASLHERAALTAWLYRIATHVCYDRFRRSSRTPLPLAVLADTDGDVRGPEADTPRLDLAIEQAEMSECVRGFLDRLSDGYRAVILLHDVEGLTNPEIAEMLGIAVGNVKIRVHRARTRLRAALDAGCAFSHDDRGVLVCEPRSCGPQG